MKAKFGDIIEYIDPNFYSRRGPWHGKVVAMGETYVVVHGLVFEFPITVQREDITAVYRRKK